ncbi:MAG TPA: TRAP transporter small permease [Candidatus Binatia bacterium]|nr:TRAP transporter small permease [Candidatus Binatia bacterium]
MRLLDRLEETLIAALMAAATAIIFVAVAHRYAVGLPWPWLQDALLRVDLSWAQELCIYLFVWMAKFGAAYGVRTGIHVGVDVLVNRLPPGPRRACILFSLGAGALFTATVGVLGAMLVAGLMHTEQTSADLRLPMWLVYLAVPCGSFLMCLRFLQVGWTFFRTGTLPKHEVAHVEGLDAVTPQAPEATR